MKRLYTAILLEHFSKYEQMAFLCGPRQVGKTTISKQYEAEIPLFKHLNWDKFSDKITILAGDEQIVSGLPIHALHWTTFLKKLWRGEIITQTSEAG